jgi:hypothetical protein
MPRNDSLSSQTRLPPTKGRARPSPSGQQAAREILLLCTTASISPGRKERVSQILAGIVDWQYLFYLAEFHGVAPLIAYHLMNNGLSKKVPQHYLERLSRIYNGTLYRNAILSNELTKVLSVFSQHGIAAIVLKGTVLADQLYGNLALRSVADMDILVQPEQVAQANSLLLGMGYQQPTSKETWEHPFHEPPYYKQAQFPLFIELHRNLDDERLVAVPRPEIWRRAQLLHIPEGNTAVLSPEDSLLFLSDHISKHSNQLLKSLNDIAELLKKYEKILDWDYIVKSARSWEIGAAVYCYLRRSQELLGAPVPASVVRALKPKAWRRWLLDFLVSREFFICTTRLTKLQDETYTIVRSLMMKHRYQTALVLTRNRVSSKIGTRLRAAMWLVLVFGAALGRNAVSIVSGRKSHAYFSGLP